MNFLKSASMGSLLLCSPAFAQIPNDTAATALTIGPGAHVEAYDTSLAVAEGTHPTCSTSGTPDPTDAWFEWAPTSNGSWIFSLCGSGYDTLIQVWDAAGTTSLQCNDDACGFQSEVTVPGMVSGVNYLIQVGGFATSSSGTGTLTITSGLPAPANDDMASPTVLPDGANNLAIDTAGATNDGVFPSCGDAFSTPATAWWEWSPDADGSWDIATIGASFNSRVTLFDATGTIELACNSGFTDAMVSANGLLDANTYLIMISGEDSTTGSAVLDIATAAPPGPGDDCSTAIPLASGPQIVPLDNTAATPSGVLPGCGGGTLPNDVWYSWAPNSSGDWLFSTCNMASFDTRLAIRSACAGIELACNDDDTANCTGFSSNLIATGLVANTSYFIQTGGFQAAQGTATMDITTVGGPPPVGVSFCQTAPNSAGAGALMAASGSASVAANDLMLTAGPMAPNEPGIFFYGPTALMPLMFGNGFRCVGGGAGTVVRVFPFSNGGATGTLTATIDNTNPAHAQMVAGAVLHFQAWFRDPAGGATGFNLSDGMTIVFGP